jgi:serine/threonine protein phosphatase PrpC
VIESIIAHAVTSDGNVREHNEDSYHIDTERGIFIVADGMGGHAAGEVASALAVRTVKTAWSSAVTQRRAKEYAETGDAESRIQLLKAVSQGVEDAHAAILKVASGDEGKKGMGTTFTGMLVAGGDAVFAHAGDSRAYLVRDGFAIQLSEDHTVVARLEAAGLRGSDLTQDPARWQGVLTNALGLGEGTRVATFIVPLYSGDRLLLCSDGVYEYVSEEEVGTIMVESPSPARSAQKYVDIALERGGADNATALVIKVVEAGETRIPIEQQQRDEAVLEVSPLLSELTPRERLRALRIATPQQFDEGRAIPTVALGDRVAYLILDGAATRADGSIARAGDLLYPDALVEGGATSVDPGRAATAVRVLLLRRGDFLELTDDDSELGIKLFDALARVMGADGERTLG